MKKNLLPESRRPAPALFRILVCGLALSFIAKPASAANIFKADNSNPLSAGGSWVGGVAPAPADTAVFDATVATAANATNVLGSSMSISVLTVSNALVPVQISADGNTLAVTNGLNAYGNNLILNCGLSITNNQTWNLAGRQITIGSAVSGPGNVKQNQGKVVLAGGGGSLPSTVNYSWAGSGTVDLGGNNQTVATLGIPWGATGIMSNGTVTVTGSGVNNPQNSGTSTLDLSGLSGVSYTGTAQAFTIVSALTTANGTVVVNLAKAGTGTNFISTASINVGASAGFNGSGAVSTLNLGPWNTFWTPAFNLSGFRMTTCNLQFPAGLTSSNLTLLGAGGNTRVGLLTIGSCNSGGANDTGNFNMGAATFICQATNVSIADQNANAATSATGNFNLGGPASTFDALIVTNARKGAVNSASTSTGIINQYGSTSKIGTLIMGDNYGTVSGVVLKAAYYLNGGTLYASNILAGADGLGLGAGSFRSINWTNGTIRNYDGSSVLTIGPGVTLSAPGAGSRFLTADAGLTNTFQNSVTQDAATATPVVKNGAGGLDLQGSTDNAFLGLNVSNGVVLLNKSSSGSIHAIGSGITLNGGSVVLSGSGGDQIANANIVTLNSGTFDINGQTETIGGLTGSGGTLADITASGTLTVNVAAGTNYTSAATITDGNLVFGGSGTQVLTGTDSRGAGLTTVNNGTLQIGNGGASGTLGGSGVTVNSPGALAFNRSGLLDFAGSISGNGNIVQNGSGTLTLSGFDAHSGSTLVNAGTLAVPSGASTIAGSVITVASGATLNTTAGSGFYIQGNQILNGSGSVNGGYILSTGATNSGNLTVTGDLTLTDGSWFNPGAAFSAGTIAVTGNVTFSSGNPNLIYNLATATTPGGGTNSLLTASGTLDLSALGTGALNLYIRGTPASGTYVIATAGSIVGSASAITVIGSTRYTYTPQIVGNQLRLVVAGNAGNLVWLGDGGANAWDANNSGNLVWSNRTSNVIDFFNTGDLALFNDDSANPTVIITSAVLPASVTVANSAVNYTFANGGGTIDGPIDLTKTNSGSLTIQNNNTFTGAVNVNGGTVSVAAVAANGSPQPLGAGTALNLNGGTFQYTGNAAGVGEFGRSITLGANGGTIDQQSSGGIYFFVTNKITGSGSLTKIGAQQLILGDGASGTGSNDYSGITYLHEGNIQIRNTYALGLPTAKTVIYPGATLSTDGTSVTNPVPENIDLAGGTLQGAGGNANYAGVITVVSNSVIGGSSAMTISGQITGSGSIDKLGSGTVTILSTNNNFTGGITNGAGNLQLGNGTANGTLPGDITMNAGSLIALPASGTTIVLPGSIHGTSQLQVNNLGGTLALTGSNDWTGNININAGSISVNNSASLGSGIKTVQMVNGTSGQPSIHLNGTNGSITLSSNLTLNCSWVGGVLVNDAGNNVVQSTIQLNSGGGDSLFAVNGGTMDLAGTIGAAAANRGFLLGGAGNGTISGSVVDSLGSAPRELKVQGTGTWTVSGTNTTIAPANVSSGKLLITGEWAGAANATGSGTLGGTGNIIGSVSIANGATFSPGTSIGTLNIGGGLTLSNGAALFIEVNKSLVQSNDYTTVTGALNAGTGTLTVSNLGPALTVGDKFTLFSQPVANGNLLTVNGGGVNWTNNLAVDGSISVLSLISTVNTNSFPLTANVSGGSLNLSWPPDRLGWKVQIQTNNLSTGLSNNWVTLPTTATVTNYSLPINPANPAVFIRMTYP